MHRIKKSPRPHSLLIGLGWVLASTAVSAQIPTGPWTLKTLFDQSWQRQPEAQAGALRREAAQAMRKGADAWIAEPAVLGLQTKTDRPGSSQGSREYEVGLALPLWLPGERVSKAALGDAELQAMENRRLAAQLELAANVRQFWWACQRAQSDLDLAHERLRNAQSLATDVMRRFKAGDMARADQFQAEATVAQAEASVAEALGAYDAAQAALAGWVGVQGPSCGAGDPTGQEPAVAVARGAALLDQHPAIAHWRAQAEVARRAARLAAKQSRANPEITVAATRSRDQTGERYRQSFTVGLRVPLGGGDRAQAKEVAARAEALEAEIRAQVEHDRISADIDAATARAKAAASQRDAMARHAALAREIWVFVDKAFRLGQADWPTRLRVELDTAQAERQFARARIDAAAAVSALRQALGLLPE